MSKADGDCGLAGRAAPVIDRNRCAGKADCVEVCPYDVFELGVLTREERAALSFVGRAKAVFSGGCQAFTVRPDDCHACGLCVSSCPEQAITLGKLTSEGGLR